MNKKSQMEESEHQPHDASNTLIVLLMQALSDEWKAMLQYKIHASRMRGLYGDPIAEHLDDHADDEKDHDERLTKHFFSHGLPIDVDIPNFNSGTETLEMIQMDLEDEVAAIDLYTQIIELCEGIPELTDTRMLIEDIIVDEVSHQDEDAAFIRAKVSEREDGLKAAERVAIASTLIKAADQADEMGIKLLADRYTKFAAEL